MHLCFFFLRQFLLPNEFIMNERLTVEGFIHTFVLLRFFLWGSGADAESVGGASNTSTEALLDRRFVVRPGGGTAVAVARCTGAGVEGGGDDT